MRFAYNDFELRPVCYLSGKNTYPKEIAVDKLNDMGTYYTIGYLKWNNKEEEWGFVSCGLRYLQEDTKELNDYLLDFCKKYGVYHDELMSRPCEDWEDDD